jgi:hypothetical protein
MIVEMIVLVIEETEEIEEIVIEETEIAEEIETVVQEERMKTKLDSL